MKIKFDELVLHCRKSIEVVNLSHQISYFHGQISAGKSSIVRLIDFCLGGDLERTKAISQELISVQLRSKLGDNDVLFERDVKDTTYIQVSWKDPLNISTTVQAPLQAGKNPIWELDVYNLSDLIFYLSGYKPIKVRKSKLNQESDLVRLSFRDLMWYCYLEQDNLDSSFYNLMDPMRRLKSRDAMRYISGYYTEKMNDLEIQFDELRNNRAAKIEAAQQIRTFLAEFGYGKVSDVTEEIMNNESELASTKEKLLEIRSSHESSTHFADGLRQKLRELSGKLNDERQVLVDLNEKINEQEALKAELISSKFKLSRVETAHNLLGRVEFEICPVCGLSVDRDLHHDVNVCYLCGQKTEQQSDTITEHSEIIRKDLNARIMDLEESINRHKTALKRQKNIVNGIQIEKEKLDQQLNIELATYDSSYLSTARELEQRAATLSERIRNLEKMVKMPEAITKIEKEASEILSEMDIVKREMQDEKNKLSDAEQIIKEIEFAYFDAIQRVGIPGILDTDRVGIDRHSWIPKIFSPDGDSYDFYNAGSGGKKTLLNVCYALAVHRVAAKNNLPLPSFLMIDTPMKNIGEDVNADIFNSFYKYLYELANNDLTDTQFLIIDKEYFPPTDNSVDIFEKFMSPDLPLISYYRGP